MAVGTTAATFKKGRKNQPLNETSGSVFAVESTPWPASLSKAERREAGRTLRSPLPWATGTISLVAVALATWPGAETALVYERAQITAGEYWRLWTAHVVHFGWKHLFWNLLVFIPAGIWAERLFPDRFRLLLLLGPIAISVALYEFDPSLARYAGLSGVAASVLTFLALAHLRAGTSDRWF